MSYKHYQQTTVLMRSFDIHHNNIKLETQASNHVPNYIHEYSNVYLHAHHIIAMYMTPSSKITT